MPLTMQSNIRKCLLRGWLKISFESFPPDPTEITTDIALPPTQKAPEASETASYPGIPGSGSPDPGTASVKAQKLVTYAAGVFPEGVLGGVVERMSKTRQAPERRDARSTERTARDKLAPFHSAFLVLAVASTYHDTKTTSGKMKE